MTEDKIYTKEDAEEMCRLAIDGYKRGQKIASIKAAETGATPRTDAEAAGLHNFKLPIGGKEISLVRAEFARMLERELLKAKSDLAEAAKQQARKDAEICRALGVLETLDGGEICAQAIEMEAGL